MATLPSPQLSSLRLQTRHSTSLPHAPARGVPKRRYQLPVCCQIMADIQGQSSLRSAEGSVQGRRDAFVHILFSSLSFPLVVRGASAQTDLQQDFRIYEDEKNKFRIAVPPDWLIGEADADGFKSITALYPGEASDSNVTIAITGLGADFTRLESFGNVDAFAESLVSGLDRSWKNPPGLAAKLINSKSIKGFYYLEYTLQNPGERIRHIISAIGIANNGWYNRLYTVTGQFTEEESEKFRSQIEKSVSSFRFI